MFIQDWHYEKLKAFPSPEERATTLLAAIEKIMMR
jgi:hypothetical protein